MRFFSTEKERQNMGFMVMKVVKPFRKDRTEEIPNLIRDTIRSKNVNILLIGMVNFDEVNANLAALSVETS